jgi:hypothetical protein
VHLRVVERGPVPAHVGLADAVAGAAELVVGHTQACPPDGGGEREVELVGESGKPPYHIGELGLRLGDRLAGLVTKPAAGVVELLGEPVGHPAVQPGELLQVPRDLAPHGGLGRNRCLVAFGDGGDGHGQPGSGQDVPV